jgi:hypothetical protein
VETTCGSSTRRYLATAGIFLIALVLMAGMISCSTSGGVDLKYALTVAVFPSGSGTATDLTSGSPYAAGTAINIGAVANAGYGFVNWSAPAGTFANANAAQTTFTMPSRNVVVTANFVAVEAVCSLTISSTTGGSVTAPGVGVFTYDEGTVVNLAADAEEGYSFIGWSGDVDTIANVDDATTAITMNGDYSIMANFGQYTPMIAAGAEHTVGLKGDGKVVAVGDNQYGQCDVGSWSGIVEVAAGCGYTVGLRSDGTVVAVGNNEYGQCNVDDWMDIVQVAAGCDHTVGLGSDGTVLAVGDNQYGQCDVGDWAGIVQVAAGCRHTVGVKSDGTVVAAGSDDDGQCDVSGWTDIVQVAAGCGHTVGVKPDGTVVAVGDNQDGQCDVSGWTDIAQVAAGGYHTVACDYYGNAFAVGDNQYGQCNVGDWTYIAQMAAGWYHTVACDYYGNAFGGGWNYYGQCKLAWWDLALVGTRDLIISSTIGGSVTAPGEGTYTYDVLAAVNLVAEAEESYHFVNWAGDVGTIADVNAASTTITIYGDYSITANFAPFAGGSGTEGDPYQIADWYDLDNVRNYLDSHFILVNDLSSTTAGYAELASPTANGGYGWRPIGTSDYRFAGIFDGQGYEIRNLFIDRPSEDRVGLFCAVLAGGVLENINVLDADVAGSDGVGALVGATAGSVSNSDSSGSVDGDSYVGGLVGYNNPGGYVTASYSTSSVGGYEDVGGLVGHNAGNVGSSHADGGVFCDYRAGGGLVGYNDDGATVDSSYSIGSITGYINAGGLVGCNDYGDVTNSHADGDVTSSAYNIGGLVGYNYYATVDNCHATGTVTGSSSSSGVGGLVGGSYYGSVSNSYAEGNVINGGLYVGGLVGGNSHGSVEGCHATGSVHGSDDCVGGLVGDNSGSVSYSYATGDVTGNSWEVGGLIGSNEGPVTKSFSTGSVSGAGLGVGGLLGYNDDTVDNSYALGAVGGGSEVGGLVGRQDYGATVNVCYSVGSVTGSSSVGGLVGLNYGTVTHSPWDTQTSGQLTSAGGTAATTAQMQDIASYGSSWDITTVDHDYDRNSAYLWNIVNGVTYPFLSWQP